MPTPLAHGVAGLAVARTVRSDWRTWHFALVAFAITLVPDLDFIPGVLVGDPGAFHRTATHSLVGAIVISAPIAALLAWLSGRRARNGGSGDRVRHGQFPSPSSKGGSARGPGFAGWYAFVLPVYVSHLLLDLLSPDTVHNSGLQLWWPITNAYAAAPLPMPDAIRPFFDLEFGPDAAGFFGTLFSGHALAVYFVEALVFSPILLLPVLVLRLRKHGRAAERPVEHNAPRGPRRIREPEPAGGNAA